MFAWTIHDDLNRAGLLHVARTRGPFAEAILLARGFGWEAVKNSPPVPKPIPAPGAGPIGAGDLPASLKSVTPAPHFAPGATSAGALDGGSARVGYLGLSARYSGTPVGDDFHKRRLPSGVSHNRSRLRIWPGLGVLQQPPKRCFAHGGSGALTVRARACQEVNF